MFDIIDKNQEEDRPQNRTLWNSADYQCKDGQMTVNNNCLFPVWEERFYPL